MFGDPTLTVPRLGQGGFRAWVLDAYNARCAITGHKIRPTLQAAHIRPVASGGQHRVDNGLLLRSDVHTMFDRGYLTVDDHYSPRGGTPTCESAPGCATTSVTARRSTPARARPFCCPAGRWSVRTRNSSNGTRTRCSWRRRSEWRLPAAAGLFRPTRSQDVLSQPMGCHYSRGTRSWRSPATKEGMSSRSMPCAAHNVERL
ncbi:HNH endonuclease [Microbacterium sp.]|uniref:HNH endonuclease n=1 Tax=Microbacterium sp. TaxID=51671 RepID=UPI003526906D